MGNFKEKWKLDVKCPKFLYCAQGFHDFEVNFKMFLNSDLLFKERLDGLLVLLLIIHAGDRGSIPRAHADNFLPFALILLNKVMENKSFFLHFLSRYKDRDATTTHRYDHRAMPN